MTDFIAPNWNCFIEEGKSSFTVYEQTFKPNSPFPVLKHIADVVNPNDAAIITAAPHLYWFVCNFLDNAQRGSLHDEDTLMHLVDLAQHTVNIADPKSKATLLAEEDTPF